MRSDQQHGGFRRFLVKQFILLLITVVLMILFTIPLLKIVKSAMNPGELKAKLEVADKENEGIQNAVDVARSKMLMGAGDEQAQEDLKKHVADLQKQMELKDIENKHLQDQMTLVQTMLQLVNAKSAPVAPSVVPTVTFSQQLAELATKIFGCIASMFSGGMFVLSWWRTREKPPDTAAS